MIYMKKLFLGLLLMASVFMPGVAKASILDDYNTLNLDEALKAEGIEHDFSNYRETDKQAVLYLFRGNGCSYCRKLLTYLSTLIKDYGDKFRVVTFESWEDPENKKLLEEVGGFLDYTPDGRVPFLVIGDQFFPGYAEDYNESIVEAIEALYDSEERYDVLEKVEEARAEEAKANKKNNGSANTVIVVLFNLLFASLSTGAIIAFVNYKNNKVIEVLSKKK